MSLNGSECLISSTQCRGCLQLSDLSSPIEMYSFVTKIKEISQY